MHLIPVTLDHIRELMSWFPDEPSVRIWGGPAFRFPFTQESFLHDAHWGRMATYVLVDDDGALLAFGQFYEKEGRVHLARLAVAPNRRGEGVGRALVGGLIAKGTKVLPGADNSLFVMRNNERAVRCYAGLGFVETVFPAANKSYPDQMFMVRRNS